MKATLIILTGLLFILQARADDRAASASIASTMAKGIYLSWLVTGPATIKAVKTAGFNAALSGVFVDESGM